jgi:hypothetical protein
MAGGDPAIFIDYMFYTGYNFFSRTRYALT